MNSKDYLKAIGYDEIVIEDFYEVQIKNISYRL